MVIDQGLTPVVWEPWQLDLLESQPRQRVKCRPRVSRFTWKSTPAMSRQGCVSSAPYISSGGRSLLGRFHSGSCLRLEGVMTHFCAPERCLHHPPQSSIGKPGCALGFILEQGLRPAVAARRQLVEHRRRTRPARPDRAMAPSTGIAADVAPRPCLYGYLDRLTLDGLSWDGEDPRLGARAGLEDPSDLVAQIASRRDRRLWQYFHRRWGTRLALLPVGYADGLNRLLSNRGHVLIRDQEAPIAGRVSMDQTMVDVTGIPAAAIGDEVVLIGSQGAQSIDAWDLADLTETIPWEVLCAISARVPRVHGALAQRALRETTGNKKPQVPPLRTLRSG